MKKLPRNWHMFVYVFFQQGLEQDVSLFENIRNNVQKKIYAKSLMALFVRADTGDEKRFQSKHLSSRDGCCVRSTITDRSIDAII